MRHTHCVPHKSLTDFDWLPGTAGTSGTIWVIKNCWGWGTWTCLFGHTVRTWVWGFTVARQSILLINSTNFFLAGGKLNLPLKICECFKMSKSIFKTCKAWPVNHCRCTVVGVKPLETLETQLVHQYCPVKTASLAITQPARRLKTKLPYMYN